MQQKDGQTENFTECFTGHLPLSHGQGQLSRDVHAYVSMYAHRIAPHGYTLVCRMLEKGSEVTEWAQNRVMVGADTLKSMGQVSYD